MRVENALFPPSPQEVAERTAKGSAGPIFMVNLLRFKEYASYDDARETGMTGVEAYRLYLEGVRELLPHYGGEVIFAGEIAFLLVGQVEDLWDEILIIRYQGRMDLPRMGASAEYQACSVHRTAGLAGQISFEATAQPWWAMPREGEIPQGQPEGGEVE